MFRLIIEQCFHTEHLSCLKQRKIIKRRYKLGFLPAFTRKFSVLETSTLLFLSHLVILLCAKLLWGYREKSNAFYSFKQTTFKEWRNLNSYTCVTHTRCRKGRITRNYTWSGDTRRRIMYKEHLIEVVKNGSSVPSKRRNERTGLGCHSTSREGCGRASHGPRWSEMDHMENLEPCYKFFCEFE